MRTGVAKPGAEVGLSFGSSLAQASQVHASRAENPGQVPQRLVVLKQQAQHVPRRTPGGHLPAGTEQPGMNRVLPNRTATGN